MVLEAGKSKVEWTYPARAPLLYHTTAEDITWEEGELAQVSLPLLTKPLMPLWDPHPWVTSPSLKYLSKAPLT
jgi:hypothetical protein